MSAIIAVLLTLVVGLSPFWLGSNRPLPWAAHAFLFGAILVATAFALIIEGRRYSALKLARVVGPLILISLGLGWAGIQLLPLSELLPTHPAWEVAASALDRPVSGGISVNPQQTQWALLNWLTAGAVFLAAYSLGREEFNATLIMRMLLLLVTVVAFYGLFRLAAAHHKILWFPQPSYGYLTSGFISRNNAATFFGMGSITALSMLIAQSRRLIDKARDMSNRDRIRIWVGALSGWLGVDLVVFVLLFISLMATGSRGGILCSLIAMLVLIVMYSVRGNRRRERSISRAGYTLIVLLVAVLILGLFELSGFRLVARLGVQGLESEARLDTYWQTLSAIRDYIWLGSGLGTFQDVFPAYRLDISSGRQVWTRAHNDYLELVLGLGVPAAVLVLLGLLGLAWKSLRGFFARRRNAHFSATAFSLSLLVALHSLVDFSLQIQAITLTFALLLGLGLAQAVSSRDAG